MPIESYKGRSEVAEARAGILPAKYRVLHTAPHVNSAVRVAEHQGKRVANERTPRIATLLDVLSDRYQNPKSRNAFIEHFLIKKENFRSSDRALEDIQSFQRDSLKRWVDHLADPDTEYPDWFKYYVLHNVTGLDRADKKLKTFHERSRSTESPFPDLNAEALDKVYRVVAQTFDETIPDDSPLRQLHPEEYFGSIYMLALAESETTLNPEVLKNTQGEWRVFKQAHGKTLTDRATEHADSLLGRMAEWCTDEISTARDYLKHGDLHILYTNDREGNPTIPRVAIRTAYGWVEDVRGILAYEEVEPELIDQTITALQGMPGSERFIEKARDLQRLGEIRAKHQTNEELSLEELRFLYGIDKNVKSFTNWENPIVAEIRRVRDEAQDMARIFNCRIDQVVTRPSQMKEDTVVLLGDYWPSDGMEGGRLFSEELPKKDYFLPPSLRYIVGNADFRRFGGKTLGNLEGIGGSAIIEGAQNLRSLGKLRHIGRNAFFNSAQLRSLGNVQNVGGDVTLGPSIRSMGALEEIGGNCTFGVSEVKKTGKLRYIGGVADFTDSNVTMIERLEEAGDVKVSGSNISSLGPLRYIHRDGSFKGGNMDFGALERIGRDATIEDMERAAMPLLKVVGGTIRIHNSQVGDMPELAVVGGEVDARMSQVGDVPRLAYVGQVSESRREDSFIPSDRLLALTPERQLGTDQSVDDIIDFSTFYNRAGGPGTPRRGDVLENPRTSQGREITVFPGEADPLSEEDIPLSQRAAARRAADTPQRRRQAK